MRCGSPGSRNSSGVKMTSETYGAALTLRYIAEELDGPEDPDIRTEMAKKIIYDTIRETAVENNAAVGKPRYEVQIHQDHGPMLVGEADVIFVHSQPRLSDQISTMERAALRAAVRRQGSNRMSDDECDKAIDEIGPGVIEKMLKASLVQ